MKKRNQDFLLGLAAMFFVALFLGTVLFLAPSFRAATRPIVIHFRHEEGLAPVKPGSPVLLSGALEVGKVTAVELREIEVESARGPRRRTVIVVTAEIDEELPLHGNCEITTDMPLIGGSGTLVIANVGTPGVPLPPDHIDGLPPQGMAAFAPLSRRLMAQGGLVDRLDRMLDPEAEGSLLNKIMLSLSDVNAMTAELRTQLSPAEEKTLLRKIHLIIDDLNLTTTAVREQMRIEGDATLLAKIHAALDLIYQDLAQAQAMLTENRPAIRNTLASVEHATRVIDDELVASLRAEFDPQNPASLLSKLHLAMERVDASLADLQVVSEAGKRMLVLNRPQIERIVANLKETSEELTLGTRELRLNPAKLIWGPGSQQESKLGVFTAARDFAQAAAFLDDAAARLQAVMELAPPGGQVPETDEEVRQIHESLRAAFEKFQRAEAFFWDQMK